MWRTDYRAAAQQGTTLFEMVVASTLLLIVSALVFQIVIPTMQRAQPGDDKQENLQRILFLRTYMVKQLNGARVLEVTADSLDYYLPKREETEYGELDRLEPSNMVEWDDSVRYRITTFERDGQQVVVNGEVDLSSGTDIFTPQRWLWNLGEGGSLQFQFDETVSPVLTMTARSNKGQYGGGVWERVTDMVIPVFAPETGS